MTRRLLYPTYWASGGTATDPDLDTTAPSFIADRYAKIGWESEKPPEAWQNFLTQISDEKVISMMIDGLLQKDASVTYQEGALYRSADKFYRIEGGVEKEVLDPKREVYEGLVASMKKLYDDHLAADNPHQDTVDTLVDKSYIKTDVDTMFGSPTDPKTIVYHKAQMGAGVHGETATSIGSLPAATGGTFTGDVTFLNEAIIQVTPSKYIHYNKATALFELVNGTMATGVDANGNGYIVGTGGASLMLSEANIDQLTIEYNPSFALPVPLLKASWRSDLSDANSVGMWTVDTPNAPVFNGGLQVDNNAAILTFDSFNIPVTVQVLVKEADGTNKSYVADFTTWTNVSNTNNLQTMVAVAMKGTNPKYFREYIVYPQLTARQKTMLVTS
jgi:hypothetical protein